MSKVRLDLLLVQRRLTESREKARAFILEGKVLVDGAKAEKAGMFVDPGVALQVLGTTRYVSRGGQKLEAALRHFDVTLSGKTAMDVGVSTGGFTDCLLQHGIEKVYAVDVGYGQLAWKLRNDARVVVLERTNIRHLARSVIPSAIDIVTIDVSFISLLKVIPKVLDFLIPGGEILALVKPQFEVDRKDIARGGVVKDESKRMLAVDRVARGIREMNLAVCGITESPLKGPKGNREYFIYSRAAVHTDLDSGC